MPINNTFSKLWNATTNDSLDFTALVGLPSFIGFSHSPPLFSCKHHRKLGYDFVCRSSDTDLIRMPQAVTRVFTFTGRVRVPLQLALFSPCLRPLMMTRR